MTPLLSVIVPIHNGGAMLEECISSILAQTWSKMEVWLIDDGSTDNSLDIIKRYKSEDSRIRIIRNRVGSGNPGSPRNQALVVAEGNQVAFVDCDDWIEPDYFERLLAYAPGYDIVWAKSYYDHVGEDWIYHAWNIPVTVPFPKYHPSEVIWDKIYSLPFLRKHRIFLGTTKATVDVPFVCKAIYYCSNMSEVDFPGYHYRRGVANSTVALRQSSSCDFILSTYQQLEDWAQIEKVQDDYKAVMDLKMARNLFYTLEIVAPEYFDIIYEGVKRLACNIGEKQFKILCGILGDHTLELKYDWLITTNAETWAEKWRSKC